ncbi:LysR family transcriptional regulator [Rubrivivax gelatinosus]|uniref:DNA-binding transcriptional LysR family regulator n=1 Tax=Rubrivivax gelatinosus TaxID=28068 RepID=A0A4R2M8G2_RUBGE|nr:LysR substrate-binding domain-containing protein [Rubrivivax gelatinosus]MBK1689636.1 LysR family transcriptional regulator [Rubrivivax gelatinosus]TCP01225.1 DNA-binding transcriptional LysR family regulator [Rubrivivax gelatinosus]
MTDAGGAPLDIVLLRSFLEVVDGGSFAVAAERLALTPSAISGHIKRLEQAAGATLLARTTRRLDLTSAGETLYAYGRSILDLEREARAKLRGAPVRGRLRVGASEDFAGTWLPQVLQRFRSAHPQASVDLKVGITADLLRQQERGRLDIVFGKQCSRVDGSGELLWEEPLVWAYATGQAPELAPQLPLAVFPEPCVYRESAISALGRAGLPWRIVFESSSMAACVSAALSGFAVTVVARSQLRDGLSELGAGQRMPELPAARFCAFARAGNSASDALVDAARRIGMYERFGPGPRRG